MNPDFRPNFSLHDNPKLQARRDKIFAKDVLIPRVVNTSLLEQYGVMNFFDCQGWRCLLVDGKPIYPLLVKQFYTYLTFNHINRSIRSSVNGREITLDESTLAKILNIPYNGWGIESLTKWSHSPLSPMDQIKTVMLDDSVPFSYLPSVSQLPPLSRVIHHLCFYNIFPRDLRYYRVTEQDMFFMSMLLSQKPVNLPVTILSYMNIIVQKDLSLPFGGILTHVFEYFNVNLDCTEIIMRPPYPSLVLDEYNLTSLAEQFPVISSEKQPMQFGETLVDQGVNPLSDVVLENSKSPFNPQVAQPSNAPTLEGIYSMVQENNSRLGTLRII